MQDILTLFTITVSYIRIPEKTSNVFFTYPSPGRPSLPLPLPNPNAYLCFQSQVWNGSGWFAPYVYTKSILIVYSKTNLLEN